MSCFLVGRIRIATNGDFYRILIVLHNGFLLKTIFILLLLKFCFLFIIKAHLPVQYTQFIVTLIGTLAFPFLCPIFDSKCCPMNLVSVDVMLDFQSIEFLVPFGCVGCVGRLVDVLNH